MQQNDAHMCVHPIRCMSHLIECLLQVGSAHALCNVSVCRMGQEELPLSSQSSANVFLPINVLLTAIHHADVTCRKIQAELYG